MRLIQVAKGVRVFEQLQFHKEKLLLTRPHLETVVISGADCGVV